VCLRAKRYVRTIKLLRPLFIGIVRISAAVAIITVFRPYNGCGCLLAAIQL